MRFQHRPNKILSRDRPGDEGPAYVRYVVNPGKNPPQGSHPSLREGYKEICFEGDTIVDTDDQETIDFLMKLVGKGKVILLDDTPKPKTYTEAEMEMEIQKRIAEREKPKEQTTYTCDVCGAIFTKKVALIGHQRSHKKVLATA